MTYADCDVLGRGEEPIDQRSHEGRVQSKFDRQFCELGVSHTLRDDDRANGDT